MLEKRHWVPAASEARVMEIAARTAKALPAETAARIEALASENREIHERECFNLNPATNVMNPRAEALLPRGSARAPRSAIRATNTRWGSRPSKRSR